MKIDSDVSLAIDFVESVPMPAHQVPMPGHQFLSLTAYIFEASYSRSATQANKI